MAVAHAGVATTFDDAVIARGNATDALAGVVIALLGIAATIADAVVACADMAAAKVHTADALVNRAVGLAGAAVDIDNRAAADRPFNSRAAAGRTRAKIDTVGRAWTPNAGGTAS